MKTSKNNFCILMISLLAISGLTLPVMANETPKFLQDIQDRLTKAGGITDRAIKIHITKSSKRIVTITPSSISFSYGFLNQMQSPPHIVATMAHMTAHISLDYIKTPPLPEEAKATKEKISTGEYLKSAVRPQYPDENNIPQASGPFHKPGAEIIERPSYSNKAYSYSVNKAAVIKEEHELESDKIAGKILKHAGFCPSDYSRMLHYFYENPQLLLGNSHFALDADQWRRLETLDNRIDPTAKCRFRYAKKMAEYNAPFNQLKSHISQELKGQKKPEKSKKKN